MDGLLDILFSSVGVGLVVGLVIAGVVSWLLPPGFSRAEIGGWIVAICVCGGFLYEFAFKSKGK